MWSTMAEEMTPWLLLANNVFKRGLKKADFLINLSPWKTVICPWKILEKSLKFVSLKLYAPWFYPNGWHHPAFE